MRAVTGTPDNSFRSGTTHFVVRFLVSRCRRRDLLHEGYAATEIMAGTQGAYFDHGQAPQGPSRRS